MDPCETKARLNTVANKPTKNHARSKKNNNNHSCRFNPSIHHVPGQLPAGQQADDILFFKYNARQDEKNFFADCIGVSCGRNVSSIKALFWGGGGV
jgi:hypothetical protein